MDESWEDISGDNRTAKDLFKLIMRRGELRVADASKMLGVEGKVVEDWTKTLIGKRYAELAGEGDAAVLKPTEDILARISGYREKYRPEELKDGTILADELSKERNARMGLEERVKDLNHIISGLNDELVQEKKERQQLEEAVEALKRGDLSAQRLADFEAQLMRERSERKRLEDILRRRDAESAPAKAAPEPVARPADKAEPSPERPPIAHQYDSPNPAVSWYKSVAEGEKEAQKPADDARVADAEMKPTRPETTDTAAKNPDAAAPADAFPDRDPTELLLYLSKKGKASENEIARELKADEKTVEGWLTELGDYGALEAVKHLFGKVEFTLKKGVSVDEIREKIKTRRVRQEMQKLRGAL